MAEVQPTGERSRTAARTGHIFLQAEKITS